ncbi:kinase phosphorylation protein-domain-containing protein [Geopyxis carbonaria]|nr:kinase phosphorylation protein-domain-containing protein [Geopyxis carbonaria]
MDLISGLRKGDTSRGGRNEFSWDQVKEDKDRENYLGHSLMAPVGRWQAKKDLTWYAKADQSAEALSAEEQRREEIRRIKEAEQDALSEALGYPVVRRQVDPVDQNDIKKAIRDAGVGDDQGEEAEEEGRGVGFGRKGLKGLLRAEGGNRGTNAEDDNMQRVDEGYRPARRDEADGRSKHRDSKDRHRRRSRSRGRDKNGGERGGRDREHRHRHRRSRSRHDRKSDRDNRHRSRSRGGGGRRERERERERHRSRSPRAGKY